MCFSLSLSASFSLPTSLFLFLSLFIYLPHSLFLSIHFSFFFSYSNPPDIFLMSLPVSASRLTILISLSFYLSFSLTYTQFIFFLNACFLPLPLFHSLLQSLTLLISFTLFFSPHPHMCVYIKCAWRSVHVLSASVLKYKEREIEAEKTERQTERNREIDR